MAWLLDTDICIYIIKQKPLIVLERFRTITPGQIAISAITLGELEYGARKSAAVDRNLSALHQFIIPLDILAFAKSVNYILVTNNEKEFNRVSGLKVENWAK